MLGISLLLGDGFVVLPLEQTLVWAMFYSTLFWLPARGVAAAVDHYKGHHGGLALEDEAAGAPCYHIGKNILPPF